MRRFLGCPLFVLLAGTAAEAQDPETQPIQIGKVTFLGSVRERYEAWNWFESASGDNLHGYSGTVIRCGFSQGRELRLEY